MGNWECSSASDSLYVMSDFQHDSSLWFGFIGSLIIDLSLRKVLLLRSFVSIIFLFLF